jgi:hypothetical protein
MTIFAERLDEKSVIGNVFYFGQERILFEVSSLQYQILI